MSHSEEHERFMVTKAEATYVKALEEEIERLKCYLEMAKSDARAHYIANCILAKRLSELEPQ